MSSDEGRRLGRRSRRGSPMPRSSFTAFVEHHIFFYILAGSNLEMSAGVRAAVNRLVDVDPEAAQMMAQAKRVVERVRERLGEDADQTEVLNYVKDHLYELLG